MEFGMEFNDEQEGTQDIGNGQESRGTAGIPGRDDERKLFVGGLSRQTTERELKEHFAKFGDIESVTVKVDPYTGQSRGFAFIVFANAATIEKLLGSGDHYINKRKVDPKRVSKKTQQGKIFVGGLTPELGDTEIRDYFSQFGTIVEIQSPFDKVKNQRKGFCFITFESKDVVFELLKQPKQMIAGKEVDVRKVKVNPDAMNQGAGLGLGGGIGVGIGRGAHFNGPQFGATINLGLGRGARWQQGSGYPAFTTPTYGSGAPFANSYENFNYSTHPYEDYTSGYQYDAAAATTVYGGPKPRGGGGQSYQRHLPY